MGILEPMDASTFTVVSQQFKSPASLLFSFHIKREASQGLDVTVQLLTPNMSPSLCTHILHPCAFLKSADISKRIPEYHWRAIASAVVDQQ